MRFGHKPRRDAHRRSNRARAGSSSDSSTRAQLGLYARPVAHGEDLLNNPLSEVFFELRWGLRGAPPGPTLDPGYKVLVGALFGRVRDEGYAFHEELDTARVPDEFVPYLIQHRFRTAEGGYPLVQVGPGIFAVNQIGNGYSWRTFKPRVTKAVELLRETYTGDLVPTSFVLRYLNSVPFEPKDNDANEFLRSRLKVGLELPEGLFDVGQPRREPEGLDLEIAFRIAEPAGVMGLKVATGEASGKSILVWQTNVKSADGDAPSLDELDAWLEHAHTVARAWFFVMIEGELEAQFNV